MNLLKTEFSQLVAEKEVGEMYPSLLGRKQMCVLWTACLGRVCVEWNEGRLLYLRRVSRQQLAGKQGLQSDNCKEVPAANDQWVCKRTLHPDENHSPSQYVDFSRTRHWVESRHPHSDFWPKELGDHQWVTKVVVTCYSTKTTTKSANRFLILWRGWWPNCFVWIPKVLGNITGGEHSWAYIQTKI